MARAIQAFTSRKPGLMIQIYIHCTPGTERTGFTYTRFTGNPEEIAAKEVTSGRYYQDRRYAGTEETEARRPQEGSSQGQADRTARLGEEESKEDGARRLEAVKQFQGCCHGGR